MARVEELTTNSRYDVAAMLALYDEASSLLHPNHHVLCDLAKWLVPVYCRNGAVPLDDFPRSDVERKQNMCSRQIRILEHVSPGLTKLRAKFIFEYLCVSIFLAVTDYNEDVIDGEELIKRLKSFVGLGKEAETALKLEPTLTHFELFCLKQTEDMVTQCLEMLDSL